MHPGVLFFFFFFNDTATTEIYTLSLHDALPIYRLSLENGMARVDIKMKPDFPLFDDRSEEHTSELQSLAYLVCRLLLEKKKQYILHSSFYKKKKQKKRYKQ